MNLPPEIILFVFSMSITPGPNNIMIMTSGLNHGVVKSIPHMLGINIGFTVMLIAIGLGLGTLFETFPAAHQVIKVVGTLYLLYLAWLIARTPTHSTAHANSKPISFFQAALFQWVNPKAWVMITSVIATYSDPDQAIWLQVLAIAGLFAVMGPPITATWLLGGVSLQRVLKTPKYLRFFNWTMAALLVISIRPVVMELLRHE